MSLGPNVAISLPSLGLLGNHQSPWFLSDHIWKKEMALADLDCWAIKQGQRVYGAWYRVWCIADPQQPQTMIISEDAPREGL